MKTKKWLSVLKVLAIVVALLGSLDAMAQSRARHPGNYSWGPNHPPVMRMPIVYRRNPLAYYPVVYRVNRSTCYPVVYGRNRYAHFPVTFRRQGFKSYPVRYVP